MSGHSRSASQDESVTPERIRSTRAPFATARTLLATRSARRRFQNNGAVGARTAGPGRVPAKRAVPVSAHRARLRAPGANARRRRNRGPSPGRCPGVGVRPTRRGLPRPSGRLVRALERAGRRRVDARAPVIPLDAVAGVRVLVDDLSHRPVPRGTLDRLRLSDDPVADLEGRDLRLPLVAATSVLQREAPARPGPTPPPRRGNLPPSWSRRAGALDGDVSFCGAPAPRRRRLQAGCV